MSLFDITLSGCDDSTRLHDGPLSDTEAAVLTRVADLAATAAVVGCQPTLTVVPSPATPTDATCAECYRPISDGSRRRDCDGEWLHPDCPDGAVR